MSLACARTRRAILDRELDRLASGPRADLARHLAICPACATLAEDEARLSAHLRGLGRTCAPPVDVRDRVLREIGARRPAETRSPLGWAVGLGLVGAASLAGWSIAAWPDLVSGLAQVGAVLEACLAVGRGILAAAMAVGLWILDLTHTAARALAALEPLARAAAPWVTTTLLALTALATATIAVAVARDLTRGSAIPVREEP
jgi:hypothetical protein